VRRLALLLALVAAGCGPRAIEMSDQCAANGVSPLIPCLDLHIRGDGPYDALLIDLYQPFVIGDPSNAHLTSPAPGGKPTYPPIAVGVRLTDHADFEVFVSIIGLLDGKPQAQSSKTTGISGHVTFDMQPLAASSCFDGVKNNDESDVDCGVSNRDIQSTPMTVCPKCGAGAHCGASSDCAVGPCVCPGDGGMAPLSSCVGASICAL
jgi:hypothetical protein